MRQKWYLVMSILFFSVCITAGVILLSGCSSTVVKRDGSVLTMTEAREEAATLSSAWFHGVPDEWTGMGERCFKVPAIFV